MKEEQVSKFQKILKLVVNDLFDTKPGKIFVKNPNNYPDTVQEVLDDSIKYRETTLEAMKHFKKSRPWQGGKKAQEMKLRRLNRDLSASYSIDRPTLVFLQEFAHGACYWPCGNLIIMEEESDGRYSVVTFLHEFGHALGKGEVGACRWSINLFRKFFPKSFNRLVPDGHLLKRAES
jgi:hypothetical protein